MESSGTCKHPGGYAWLCCDSQRACLSTDSRGRQLFTILSLVQNLQTSGRACMAALVHIQG